MSLYYDHAGIQIYHGDCREILPGITGGASAVVTDPPYGIGWKRGRNAARSSKAHAGILGDSDTSARDELLAAWGEGPAVVFGSLAVAPPAGLVQTLIWRKPADAGVVGSDYPVQGTKSQRFLQVGNAVPPLLAKAILTALIPAELLAQIQTPESQAA